GDGKTVFRTGIGVYYDRNFGNVLFNVMQNPPSYSTLRLLNVSFNPALLDNPYAVFPNTPQPLLAAALRSLDQNMRTAYTLSWDVRREREIKKSAVVAATY